MPEKQNKREGFIPCMSAFIMWGALPAYWKLLDNVPAGQILAHRIVWSFLFMLLLVYFTGRFDGLKKEAAGLLIKRHKLFCLFGGAALISMNWFTFIWAVTHERIVETSLGYYITPLTNVLVGVTVLRERLTLWQLLAIVLATVGVMNLTLKYDGVPWVALILAVTMTCYSLCKKVTGLSAISGMTLETSITAPFAIVYLILIYSNGQGVDLGFSLTTALLVGAGIVTATPLLMWAYGLNNLSFVVVGLMQYIAPTLTLILGVLAYHEDFSHAHKISFAFIWMGLLVFSLSKTAVMQKMEERFWSLFRPKF